MMCENQNKEILWVEDENNLMELTLKTLLSHEKGTICLTKNPREIWEKGPISHKESQESISKDLSIAVLFTKHDAKDNKNDFLNVNPKIEAVPLLMLMGPADDMKNIMTELVGRYGCFKESVNIHDFLKKMKEFPMYWVSIDTTYGIERK